MIVNGPKGRSTLAMLAAIAAAPGASLLEGEPHYDGRRYFSPRFERPSILKRPAVPIEQRNADRRARKKKAKARARRRAAR